MSLEQWPALSGPVIVAVIVICVLHAFSNRFRHTVEHDITRTRRNRLNQIYPVCDDSNEKDSNVEIINIIAIHGLDTDSSTTWTWKGGSREVNWLTDPAMLPSKIEGIRIFTYDWPADLRQPSDQVQRTLSEYATHLHDDIRMQIGDTADSSRTELPPILFIASCLGGILLLKAHVDNSSADDSVRKATRGVVFLGTPFRGTSFDDIAALATPTLNFTAWMGGHEIVSLLDFARKPDMDLIRLVQEFTRLARKEDYQICTFYEKGKTSLPSKVFPWLPSWLRREKQLVGDSSATLDAAPDPIALNRAHLLMNKFGHDECRDCLRGCTESADFGRVSSKIADMIRKIREGSPLQQADEWIRTQCYDARRLKIERLSGELLPLDSCYVNLIVVEPSTVDGRAPGNIDEYDAPNPASQFSLAARLKVEAPHDNSWIELDNLFDPREACTGQTRSPAKILIRGRAGVGKTTLCKKIVHEFISGSGKLCKLTKQFDRILWIPLRRLKDWSLGPYDLEGLLSYVFLNTIDRKARDQLARALCDAVNQSRTLLLLDGLDEVQNLDIDKAKVLEDLLNQTHVIVTARPQTSLSAMVRPVDLELETVGFSLSQVHDYLEKALGTPKIIAQINSYLECHGLVRDLVRIPIQLDALCFTWESLSGHAKLNTMTKMYQAIETNLWKKDILRLKKLERSSLRAVTFDGIQHEEMDAIQHYVENEILLLELLAFVGLYDDVVCFDIGYWVRLFKSCTGLRQKGIHWNTTLTELSFLRTSDPLLNGSAHQYHFLHLTFQEYFAAKYFVRQWRDKGNLECVGHRDGDVLVPITAASLIADHKYDSRYNIFWRFVAGLLDTSAEVTAFFAELEHKPLDLLGPTHLRLVTYCSSEVDWDRMAPTTLRSELEEQLGQWLVFEYRSMRTCYLVCEPEYPEKALMYALHMVSDNERSKMLYWISRQLTIHSNIINVARTWLDNGVHGDLTIPILRILRHHRDPSQDHILQDVMTLSQNDDQHVRSGAFLVLSRWIDLPRTEAMLPLLVACLRVSDEDVRSEASKLLQARINLPEMVIRDIVLLFGHDDPNIRSVAVRSLSGRQLPQAVVDDITDRLRDDDRDVRIAGIKVLQSQSSLSVRALQQILACAQHKDWYVSTEARDVLQNYVSLPEVVLEKIAALIQCVDVERKWLGISLLTGKAHVPEPIVSIITANLSDEDPQIRTLILGVLGAQAELPQTILDAVATQLQDESENVRRAVISVYSGRNNLPIRLLGIIVQGLCDKDEDVREESVETLQLVEDLPESVLEDIAALFQNDCSDIQSAAIEALQGRQIVSEAILRCITALLEHKDARTRLLATRLLRGQKVLPDATVELITGLMWIEDSQTRVAACKVFVGRPDVPNGLLEDFGTLVRDEDTDVRCAAFIACQGRGDLQETVTRSIVAHLGSKHAYLRSAAQEMLKACTELPVSILEDLLTMTRNKNSQARWSAIRVLSSQTTLTDAILVRISDMTKDKDKDVRWQAIQLLRQESDISVSALECVAALLRDSNEDFRSVGSDILQKQHHLPQSIRNEILMQLQTDDPGRRWSALKALRGRDDLSEPLIRDIATQLQDEDEDVRSLATRLIIAQSALPLDAIYPHLDIFVRSLLRMSFSRHLYLHITGASVMGVGARHVPLSVRQGSDADVRVRLALEKLGTPPLMRALET